MRKHAAPVAALLASSIALAGVALATPAIADTASAFERVATYPVHLNAPEGVDPAAETVAEISTVTPDGQTLIYTDAAGQRIGFLDISDPANPVGTGTVSLEALGNANDEPTSVAAVGEHVLVVIDESAGDFANPRGRVDVLRIADRQVVASIDLGGQPDSIDISADGAYAAIAIENQRDEDLGDGGLPQLPAGYVQVIELAGEPTAWTADPVHLVDETGAPLPIVAAAGLDTPEDPEPEYVTINGRNEVAVTLQENNGVVVIDLATREITQAWSAGTVSVDGIDTVDDAEIDLSGSIVDVPREPDAIAWIGDDRLATANEGDWKGGSRGWTVFDIDGTVVWDAGASFEHLAVRHGLHNNDRAAKKGTEPEGLAVAEYHGTTYAFVASERSNFVAVYDLADSANPEFVQLLFTTNGPEGILPIPSRDLLAVSSEVDEADNLIRSSVNVFALGGGETQPSIVSGDDADGLPIGWTALGALTADPTDPGILYTASDAALATAWFYTVDVAQTPALITERTQVMKDGAPATYDIEGLFARPQGGFWLAVEGATGPENLLVRIDDDGAVLEEIALPAEVADHIRNWGLEGVTATTGADGAERVYVAVQRPLWVDPNATPREALEGENTARIGEYDPATGEWAWFGYELETTAAAGDWIGLSEITAVDERTFAVVERDKRNGPDAAIKRVYTVAIPDRATIDAADGALIPLEKSLAIDVLPMLQATNGWTQEKLEGFTIAADGRVYAVTDNDGLEDANGETVFLRLGDAAQYFDLGGPVDEPTAEPTAPAVDPTAPASGDDATDDAGAPAAGDLASTGAADAQLVALLAAGALLAGAAALLANRARRSA